MTISEVMQMKIKDYLQRTKRESCLSLDCADESVIDAKI